MNQRSAESFGGHRDDPLRRTPPRLRRRAQREFGQVESEEQVDAPVGDQSQRTHERAVHLAVGARRRTSPVNHHIDPLEQHPTLVELPRDRAQRKPDAEEIRRVVAPDLGGLQSAG